MCDWLLWLHGKQLHRVIGSPQALLVLRPTESGTHAESSHVPGYRSAPLLPGIRSHAAVALATDKPAQISMMRRNPNTNASRTDSLIAVPVVSFRLVGNWRPASLISPA